MDSTVNDNAASRLCGILHKFQAVQVRDTDTAMDAWKLALDAPSPSELFARLAEFSALVESLREHIRSLPEEDGPDFLLMGLEPLDGLIERFTRLGSSPKKAHDAVIKPALLQALNVCATMLRRQQTSVTISDSDLRDLLDDVQKWLVTVADDDNLSSHDKIFILQRLRDIEAALLGFFLGGFEKLETAVSALAGAALTCESARERTFLDKVAGFWEKVVSVAQGSATISKSASEAATAIAALSDTVK